MGDTLTTILISCSSGPATARSARPAASLASCAPPFQITRVGRAGALEFPFQLLSLAFCLFSMWLRSPVAYNAVILADGVGARGRGREGE